MDITNKIDLLLKHKNNEISSLLKLTDELIEENKELKKEIQILKDEQVELKSAIGNKKPL